MEQTKLSMNVLWIKVQKQYVQGTLSGGQLNEEEEKVLAFTLAKFSFLSYK
jgi:hypothetical protein